MPRTIIFFVFLVGGAFAVLRRTGAIDSLIAWLLERFEGRPNVLVAGRRVPLRRRVVDHRDGRGVHALRSGAADPRPRHGHSTRSPPWASSASGTASATEPPPSTRSRSSSPRISPASNRPRAWPTASILFVVFVAVGIHHVCALRPAGRGGPGPQPDAGRRVGRRRSRRSRRPRASRGMHRVVLVVVVASIALLVWGIKAHHWYLNEMGALFLGLSLVLILITRHGSRYRCTRVLRRRRRTHDDRPADRLCAHHPGRARRRDGRGHDHPCGIASR